MKGDLRCLHTRYEENSRLKHFDGFMFIIRDEFGMEEFRKHVFEKFGKNIFLVQNSNGDDKNMAFIGKPSLSNSNTHDHLVLGTLLCLLMATLGASSV